MMESTKPNSHSTSEIVAYHKLKTDISKFDGHGKRKPR